MLTYKNALSVIAGVKFDGDNSDPAYWIPRSKAERKAHIARVKGDDTTRRIAAAIEIQRVWKGCCIRLMLSKEVEKWFISHKNIKSEYPHLYVKYKGYLQWCKTQGLDNNSSARMSLEDYAAQLIQSWWKRSRSCVDKNSLLDRARRSEPYVKKKRKKKLDVKEAALVIQRSWRRHNDIKVFGFYRELINFRCTGDPAVMLRSINPKEAQLLDKATGAYVRFRLGGARFPPNIYYKIFTHRSVVDICACSPRDYTAMANRLQQARDKNNQESRSPYTTDKTNWYKRYENNGWRLVSNRLFLSPCQDSVTAETSSVRQDFHHSKLQRRQDVMRKHKQRKIEWLRKLYKEGMVKPKGDIKQASRSEVDLATAEVMALINQEQPEEVKDKDIDDLLCWTDALNFDEYVTEWYSSASSGFSDENHDIYPSEYDKYEVYIATSRSKPK